MTFKIISLLIVLFNSFSLINEWFLKFNKNILCPHMITLNFTKIVSLSVKILYLVLLKIYENDKF